MPRRVTPTLREKSTATTTDNRAEQKIRRPNPTGIVLRSRYPELDMMMRWRKSPAGYEMTSRSVVTSRAVMLMRMGLEKSCVIPPFRMYSRNRTDSVSQMW